MQGRELHDGSRLVQLLPTLQAPEPCAPLSRLMLTQEIAPVARMPILNDRRKKDD